MSDSQMDNYKAALKAAMADVEEHGESLETMVFADYVDESGNASTRAFQWARKESRYEFSRFMTWCINHKRTVRITPFNLY